MAEAQIADDDTPKKGSKLPLILGLVLALGGGGGGFFAVYSGLILGADKTASSSHAESAPAPEPLPDVTFVEVDPMVVSIGAPADRLHLRFRTHLEVAATYAGDVEQVLPRVVDVLNS